MPGPLVLPLRAISIAIKPLKFYHLPKSLHDVGNVGMARLSLNTRESVIAAAKECDSLGREHFLRKHGFGKSRKYYLFLSGKHYDSKAIYGVAFGVEHPTKGPLSAEEFSGGEATVQRVLEELGFTVVRGRPARTEDLSALVLVENEVTMGGKYDFWEDDTGVQYQYPNQYKNRIQSGRPFVYYRGVRRSGGKRGQAEYFGTGTIGEVWQDPTVPRGVPRRGWRWFCSIEDYQPFEQPVPAKPGSRPYEKLKSSMGWRTAVREIPWDTFQKILDTGRATPPGLLPGFPGDVTPVSEVHITEIEESETLLIHRPRTSGKPLLARGRRNPRRAKEIGDRAEELVYHWLRDNRPGVVRDSVDWLAQRGETPGWDIEYTDQSGARIAVEVKGTTVARFTSIELTANEWKAAGAERDKYMIALVTSAFAQQPGIAMLRDPYGRVESGGLEVEPTGWRISNPISPPR